jgi:hypothetical protein
MLDYLDSHGGVRAYLQGIDLTEEEIASACSLALSRCPGTR